MILLILSYDDPIILSEIFMLKFPDYQFDPLFVSGNANILEWKIFYVVLSMCLSIFPYYIIICYCRSQTLKILESRWNELTEKTRRIHLTLLHALTFQATLPAVFTFAVAVFALGALNIYNHPILEYSTFALVSLIPSLAPLGTLHFIRPYREWLEGTVLRWRAKVTNSAEPSVPSVVAEVLENKN